MNVRACMYVCGSNTPTTVLPTVQYVLSQAFVKLMVGK